MAYIVMAHTLMAYADLACTVVAYIVIGHGVMARTVIACITIDWLGRLEGGRGQGDTFAPCPCHDPLLSHCTRQVCSTGMAHGCGIGTTLSQHSHSIVIAEL